MTLTFEKHSMSTPFYVFSPFFQMDINPWRVDSILEFSFLKCPECTFDTKEEDSFQYHATENHPLSFVFFGKIIKEENFSDSLILEELKPEIIEDHKAEGGDSDNSYHVEEPIVKVEFSENDLNEDHFEFLTEPNNHR